jgi:hypothetical protein
MRHDIRLFRTKDAKGIAHLRKPRA